MSELRLFQQYGGNKRLSEMRPYSYSLSRAAGEYQLGRHEANLLNGNRNVVMAYTDNTDRLVRHCPDSITDVHCYGFPKDGLFHAPASHH
ncbi:MAG: hypothetical protein QOF74_3351 [Caballeronia mineralivorans]|nr:hypothetical protein [Caballeronia mineralivorans]